MAFCKFSNTVNQFKQTIVDNDFIYDFMPSAPSICPKVYLLGLSMCQNPDDTDNTITKIAKLLNVCEEDVMSAFAYWQGQGLVEILNVKPVEIRYLPIDKESVKVRTYNTSKYKDFNLQMQEIIKRQISLTEYDEYYQIIEDYHMTPEALVMVAKYCADLKSEMVSRSYISTVAKNWAKEGVLTSEDVEEKIKSLGILDDNLQQVFDSLGLKRNATIEDRTLLNKWMNELGYDLSFIKHIPLYVKKKRRLEMIDVDAIISNYYELRLRTIQEIENYENNKTALYSTAKKVVKNLGLRYDDLSKVIETYIIPMNNMGYDEYTLTEMADYCFKNSIKTLESFNAFVEKMFSLGIVSAVSFSEYLENIAEFDSKIKLILDKLNILRKVNSFDRTLYKTWTENWHFDETIIEYASTLAVGMSNPLQYMNKVLSNWFINKVDTLEKAKNTATNVPTSNANENKKSKLNNDYKQQNFSKEFLDGLITNLDEVDV